MKTSEILDRAADLITPEGAWCQGAMQRSDGDGLMSYCALGAMYEVRERTPDPGQGDDDSATHALVHFLGLVRGSYVASWNDAPARKQAEVVAALHGAAQREREAGR